MSSVATLAPETFAQAASALRAASAHGRRVRIAGAGTKLRWGRADVAADAELYTTGLDRIVAHNAGDMTATLQAGVSLAKAQRAFARAGQMLALDPPGSDPSPTIGGIVATADCGPLSHRYGAPRELVVGATMALSDGTIAKSGGTVIKNVAGYDIAKLLAGSFGTLGLILSVNVRLHPRPQQTATATGATADARALTAAALTLAALPAELNALDIAWSEGRGRVLAQVAGPQSPDRARRLRQAIADAGLDDASLTIDDASLWDAQRDGQRCADRAIVRVAARPSGLTAVLAAADACGGSVVGRAALGHSYVALEPSRIAALRAALPADAHAVVQDRRAGDDGAAEDPWGAVEPAQLALMRSLKLRFDPTGTCNPGLFVGGI